MTYRHLAAGYLVQDGKVFLVHHKKFDKWTPPGGHIEPDETPDQAVIRECKEELGLDIEVVPAYPSAFGSDSNSTPIPMPFHMDLEREGFDVPHIAHFFYVKLKDPNQLIKVAEGELHNFAWFTESDIPTLKTFDQVKSLAQFALKNYPNQ